MTTNDNYKQLISVTINAIHKKTLEPKDIFLTNLRQPLKTENYYPIVLDLIDIGSSTHNELPTERKGTIEIDNSQAIGFKRRFSDLTDEYILVNRSVKISIEDIESGEQSFDFVGRVDSLDFAAMQTNGRINVTKRVLETRPITYRVKDGSDVVPGAMGSVVPAVFGLNQEVEVVQIKKNVWGYGTNLVNANGTFFSRMPFTSEYVFVDTKGNAGIIDQFPSDVSTPFITYAGSIVANPSPTEFDWRQSYIIRPVDFGSVGSGFTEVNRSARILTEVELEFHGSTAISDVEEGEFFTVEIWEAGQDIIETDEWGEHLVPQRVVATGRRSRKDFETQLKTYAPFTVRFVLDKPVAFVPWHAGTNSGRLQHAIGISQDGAVGETASLAEVGSGTRHRYLTFITQGRSSDMHYANFQGTAWGIKLWGARLTDSHLTPATLVSGGYEDAGSTENIGLAPSVVTMSVNNTAIGGVEQLSFNDLRFIVKTSGLRIPGTSSIATRADQLTRLLSAKYTGSAWSDAHFDTSMFSDTHTGAQSGPYARRAAGTFTGYSFNRDLLRDLLFWMHGKLVTAADADENIALLLFGTTQSAVAEISDEDCIIDRVQELDLSTVVNAPYFDFARKLIKEIEIAASATEGSDFNAYFNGNTDGLLMTGKLEALRQKSQTFYGFNALRNTRSLWIGTAADAITSAKLFIARFGLTPLYIIMRGPLRRYRHIQVGQVFMLPHPHLPSFFGGDSADVPGLRADEATLAPDAADGDYQKSGRVYRCLVEGREISSRAGEPPMLKLSLLVVDDIFEGMI